ncbi:MAG: LamG domain-containing protein [Planctomycetes bacterium]|nr:LamG domain-containing protein [Planctomycetota bacterium]NOG53693.1 LamG domain-containing protein [Planctomycetota bacterium]
MSTNRMQRVHDAVAKAAGLSLTVAVAGAANAQLANDWHFNGSVYDEMTGTYGEVHGTEAYTDGACPDTDQGFAFIGDTWIDSNTTIQLYADDSISFSCWIRLPSDPPNGWLCAYGFEEGGGHAIHTMFRYDYIDGPTYQISFYGDDSSVGNLWAPYEYFDGQYHHFVVVRDGPGDMIRTYIDGVFDDETADNSGDINFSNTQELGIGCQWHSSGAVALFAGDMDELRIYDHALSEQEIADLAQCSPDPELAITGDCPSMMTMSATGLTPGGTVVFLVAPDVGSFTIPNDYMCAGTLLGLNSRVLLGMVSTANNNGETSPRVFAAPAVCGYAVQVVDLSTCKTSNVDWL